MIVKTPSGDSAAPVSAGPPTQHTPDLVAQITAFRLKTQANMGQIVLAIMNLPRYRHQTLGDLEHNRSPDSPGQASAPASTEAAAERKTA